MKRSFTNEDIDSFEQRYRAAFINSLSGYKSIALIGTIDRSGRTNLAIFNSFFHLGANPPLFGFVVRPDSVERHTWENIQETSFFTVNHIHEGIVTAAHQTSARYTRNQSEFTETGLTPEYKQGFIVPFVKESEIQIGAEFLESKKIERNGTIIVIAGIRSVYLPENCLRQDGLIELEKAGTITGSGIDSYHKATKIARLSYAKPGIIPKEIE